MLLQKSLVKLLSTSGASSMRLWGKIKGTNSDYFVAEGTLEGGEAAEEGAGEAAEARGTGVNKFVYWVANSPLAEWTQLPDIKPSDIINSRGIKHSFSGDVNAKIFTNPFYFDKESLYLRCQIARISQSTTLVPKGLMKFVDETGEREIEPNVGEEDAPVQKPTTQAMCSLDMWLHTLPSILKQGRVKHARGEPIEEGEEEESIQKREVTKDPWEPMLKSVTKDAKTRGGMPAWILRSHNMKSTSQDARPGKPVQCYGCVVVKSLWWPGAMSLYNQGRILQLYVGDGQKLEPEGMTYYPVNPPVMIDEKDEVPVQAEPNPTEEKAAEPEPVPAAGNGEEVP